MPSDFDHIAKTYDKNFSYSLLGIIQRKLVYDELIELPCNQQILEINCGTGEDAIWLDKQGHNILATDISQEMIKVANKKKAIQNSNNISFELLELRQLNTFQVNRKMDLILSNFGGLNCISKNELKIFFKAATSILTKDGRIVLVVMPKHCLWESFYFLIKGKRKMIFRRHNSESVTVNVEGKKINTWYFDPKEIKEIAMDFTVEKIKPIGFFVPPSYLNPFFKKHIKILRILENLEKMFGRCSFLAKYSDHYLIELKQKQ